MESEISKEKVENEVYLGEMEVIEVDRDVLDQGGQDRAYPGLIGVDADELVLIVRRVRFGIHEITAEGEGSV